MPVGTESGNGDSPRSTSSTPSPERIDQRVPRRIAACCVAYWLSRWIGAAATSKHTSTSVRILQRNRRTCYAPNRKPGPLRASFKHHIERRLICRVKTRNPPPRTTFSIFARPACAPRPSQRTPTWGRPSPSAASTRHVRPMSATETDHKQGCGQLLSPGDTRSAPKKGDLCLPV